MIAGVGAAAGADVEAVARARVFSEDAKAAIARLDYGRAEALLRDAEAAAFPDGPADLQASILAGKGRVFWALGQFGPSRDAYVTQAELLRRAGDAFGEARALYSVAVLVGRLRTTGQVDRTELVRAARAALDAAVRTGNPDAEARARLYFGQQLVGTPGIEQFEKALAISRRIGDRQSARFAKRLLAWYVPEANPSRRGEAERWLDETVEEARRDGDLQDVARGLIVRSWLLWTTGDRPRWIEGHLQAIEAVERIRDLQKDEMIRARLFSQWAFIYYQFAGRLLDELTTSPDPAGDLALAVATVERMRSRVLLDIMDAAGARHAGARLHAPSFVSTEDIRSRLAPDQALLSFHFASGTLFPDPRNYEGGAWAILVTRGGAEAFPIARPQDLPDRVAVLQGLFRRRDGSESLVGEDLYRSLLEAPLRKLDPAITRLVIVPDGCLNRIPFAALPAESGVPLARRFTIEMVPSATLWTHWKDDGARDAVNGRALALADPDLSFLPPGAATFPGAAVPERLAPGPLPGARREAKDLASALPQGSVVLTGRAASEFALKKAALKEFGIVHLAAHAILDDERPERSAVLLTPGDGEDGRLQVKEIVGLPLHGKAVILTACRSASGAWIEGEGVMGLARAFFEAGSRAVVGSLWPLRDDETAALIRDFASGLARGRTVAESLAGAQRAAIASGTPAAAWAGLVVLGDGDFVPVPTIGPG
jgi:tetratricopeptide (TPR) repeat protein